MRRSTPTLTTDDLFSDLLSCVNERFGGSHTGYEEYQGDPVGFAEIILKETLTPDIKRMMESVRDNPVTICVTANGVGKTHGAARVALWWLLCFSESQCYTAAAPPESNLRRLLWGEIGSVIERHANIFQTCDVKTLHVGKTANSFLTGVAIPATGTSAQREARFSGKHAPHLLFVLDEGDAIDDAVYKGIESCLSGGHGRLLVMFNPRAEQGAPYRMIRDGRANVVSLSAFNHPNVLTGKDIIPGAVDRTTTVRRINQWCRPLNVQEKSDSNCFELPDFLTGATTNDQSGRELPPLTPGTYKIVEQAFSYMVLGQYPTQASNQLISREWINQARSRWDLYVLQHGERPPIATLGVMGLDIAEFGVDANAACIRYGGWVERILTWSGVDIIETADRAAEEYHSRSLSSACVDATGVGAGVAPQMNRKRCAAVPVKVAERATLKTDLGEFRIMRDQLWWSCREWLRADPGAMLPPDETLIEELLVATYGIDNGKIRVMKKSVMRDMLKRSPDKADSLCLTFYENSFFAGCDLT
jgi:hypothetical protein